MSETNGLLILFPASLISGAHFWDRLQERNDAWKKANYKWLGDSCYGDQIVQVFNVPMGLTEGGIYVLGPDIAGPRSLNSNWPENLLMLATSIEQWQERIAKYGDEYALAPGCIGDEPALKGEREKYRSFYQLLNPGLAW